jgi:chromosome transmission fidelity protein 1
VTLPYPLLLQKSAREALDLSLKDHIVIIDEAHNLMDAIAGIYSVSITLHQAHEARTQLTTYLQKFRNKLKGKNRVYVAQILRLIDSIIAYLQTKASDSKASDGIVDVRTLMTGKSLDQINVYKLNAYLQGSRLARKVDGYTTFAGQAQKPGQKSSEHRDPRRTVPVLTQVQAFLMALMNPSDEGRFFYSSEEASSMTLKYMLLDPTFHFKEVVEEARAVVLAGGTMSPVCRSYTINNMRISS